MQGAAIGGSVNSWANRAIDWYNAERRIIFACDPLSNTSNNLNKDFFTQIKQLTPQLQ